MLYAHLGNSSSFLWWLVRDPPRADWCRVSKRLRHYVYKGFLSSLRTFSFLSSIMECPSQSKKRRNEPRGMCRIPFLWPSPSNRWPFSPSREYSMQFYAQREDTVRATHTLQHQMHSLGPPHSVRNIHPTITTTSSKARIGAFIHNHYFSSIGRNKFLISIVRRLCRWPLNIPWGPKQIRRN